MSFEQTSFDVDRVLRVRLKQVRDGQPPHDFRDLMRIRRIVMARARRRRWLHAMSATVVAATAVVGLLAVPKDLTQSDRSMHRRAPLATSIPGFSSADPWVIASARQTPLEGDGWIPRPGTPNS